jgi:hypothetical protein
VRTIVVGDIHGCYDELVALLDRVSFGPEDRLVAVGDLVAKGPKIREVLDLFISDARLSSVLGNHDRAVLRRLRGEKIKVNKAQKRCYKMLRDSGETDKYCSYLASLPLWIDLGDHLIIHAGLRPGIPLAEQSEDDLVELRGLGGKRIASRKGDPWYEVYEGEKFVLFGHWPSESPRRGPRALGLDTGCVYGFELTAYVVESGELVSVPAARDYDEDSREAPHVVLPPV